MKPILRGRDIQRYRANWADLWLIAAFPSRAFDIEEYSSVKNHLLTYGKQRLEQSGLNLANGDKARKKTPHAWYELQDTCAYHELFEKPKLLWRTMADSTTEMGAFVFDESGFFYPLDSAFMMTGKNLHFLYGVLNSPVISWYVSKSGLTTGMGIPSWKKFVVDEIPIIDPGESEIGEFASMVSDLMIAVDRRDFEEIRDLEGSVNSQVVNFYGLTPAETSVLDRFGY